MKKYWPALWNTGQNTPNESIMENLEVTKKLIPVMRESAAALPCNVDNDFLDYTAKYLAMDSSDWPEEEKDALENWDGKSRRKKQSLLRKAANTMLVLLVRKGRIQITPQECPVSMLFLSELDVYNLLRAVRKANPAVEQFNIGGIAALFQNGDIHMIPGIGEWRIGNLRTGIEAIYRQFCRRNPFDAPAPNIHSEESSPHRMEQQNRLTVFKDLTDCSLTDLQLPDRVRIRLEKLMKIHGLAENADMVRRLLPTSFFRRQMPDDYIKVIQNRIKELGASTGR